MSTAKHPNLDPAIITPFIDKLRMELLEKVKYYGIPLEPGDELNTGILYHAVNGHENEQRELTRRMNEQTQLKLWTAEGWIGEWELETLDKARTYKIPYDLSSLDWNSLTDMIEEYEELLTQAADYGISWSLEYFDLIALRQEIEAHERRAMAEEDSLRYDYYSSIQLS